MMEEDEAEGDLGRGFERKACRGTVSLSNLLNHTVLRHMFHT